MINLNITYKVTDHAVLRYLQRLTGRKELNSLKGFNVRGIKQYLADNVKGKVANHRGRIEFLSNMGMAQAIIRGNTVVTIVK